jgi:DNA polymerase elongation subunit (family B)
MRKDMKQRKKKAEARGDSIEAALCDLYQKTLKLLINTM